MPRDSLTAKQERFCQLYTTYWNATRAAKEAGYSEDTASVQGWELLNKTLVKARIKELTDHALGEIGISRQRVLQEYARLAFYDLADAYDEIGQLKPVKEMPEDIRRVISKVKAVEIFDGQGEGKTVVGFTKDIEFAQKKGALDSIAKVLGMAPDKVEHSGPDGKPIETVNKQDMTREQIEARIQFLLSKRSGSDEDGASE